MLLPLHLNLDYEVGAGGIKWQQRRKRTWKTTREILEEMREEREEELARIANEPVSQWPEPVDDWMKRKMIVGILLEQRRKRKGKIRRIAAGLLLLDD